MDRQRRRIAERVARTAAAQTDLDPIHEVLLEGLASALDLDSACWHACDPATGFPTSAARAGDPPGSFEESLRYELADGEVNRFADLRARPRPVAAIGLATGGRPSDSPRFREMIQPAGAADELRVSLSDAFGHWSAAVLFSRRRLTEDDVALVAAVLPAATAAVRIASAAQLVAAREPARPAVVVLDAADRILAADATARRRLRRLVGGGDEVPGVLAFLAAQARRTGARERVAGRTRTVDGAWLSLDASLLDGDTAGHVAIVLQPAPGAGILDAVLRSFGLTAREREVAALAAGGGSTKAIAAELGVSRWTVADHLKSAYEKTGASSRADLASLAAP